MFGARVSSITTPVARSMLLWLLTAVRIHCTNPLRSSDPPHSGCTLHWASRCLGRLPHFPRRTRRSDLEPRDVGSRNEGLHLPDTNPAKAVLSTPCPNPARAKAEPVVQHWVVPTPLSTASPTRW
eukprot:2019047-Pyramimonas_sp.AAC.1